MGTKQHEYDATDAGTVAVRTSLFSHRQTNLAISSFGTRQTTAGEYDSQGSGHEIFTLFLDRAQPKKLILVSIPSGLDPVSPANITRHVER